MMKITERSSADANTNDVKITVPIKYSSNFWRIHEMPYNEIILKLISF